MSKKNKSVFDRLYGSAQTAADLPWHDPEPPPMLVAALDQRGGGGRALDIGCGGGTYSLYMASRGYTVTALDFMPQAVEITRAEAARAGADVTAVQADITSWSADHQFDVILDVGCLHSLSKADRQVYRQQLMRWLAPGGDFVLVHCSRRGWWDGWPVGPSRVARRDIEKLFSPELELVECLEYKLENLPLFMGRSALTGRYWFRRKAAN